MSAGEEQGNAMNKFDYALLALATLILAAAFVISPEGSATSNPHGEPANDMYFLSTHRSAAILPDEEFPPY
jgi:hypothetical protein